MESGLFQTKMKAYFKEILLNTNYVNYVNLLLMSMNYFII